MRQAVFVLGSLLLTMLPALHAAAEPPAQAPPSAPERTFDVVVFGATPGGVTAAVGAAREKDVRVALVEPLGIVGGVMSSGLSFSDSNQTDRRVLGGLFEEIHLRIEKHYHEQGVTLPYQVAVKNHDPWTYEPHVAEKVFLDLLAEAGVSVFLNEKLVSTETRDGVIHSLTTGKSRFRASVFVDATYEGDLMARAGVRWKLGREGRAEHGESYAGRQYPKPPVNGVDPRDDQGRLLPLMTAENAGDAEAGDRRVMVYSFRLCLTKDPENRIPIQKPANYDPAQFELVRRFVAAHPPRRLLFDLYPLPGNKLDGNNSIGGQLSIGLVGASHRWCEASYEEREKIWQAHRDHTEGLLWFMANDPAMPAALREEMRALGYCRDEFARWGHFPPVLYVREGRRMQGEYVLTQHDILEQVEKEDSIAVASFPIDSHDVQRVPTPDGQGFVNEGTIFPVRLEGRRLGNPYQVPYRAITPRRGECRNLLVPVALSCTHVAFSSIRVEPTWMVLGHSAGVAAALAAKQQIAVQDLSYAALRERLLAQGQALDPLPLPPLPTPAELGAIDPSTLSGIVLDDRDAEKEGRWVHSTNFKPFVGQGYVYDGDPPKVPSRLTFRPEIPRAGRYHLRLAYSPHPTRAAHVPLTIVTEGESQRIEVDQRQPLEPDSPFRTVATLELPAGKDTTITISNQETEGFVIFDAFQLVEAKE